MIEYLNDVKFKKALYTLRGWQKVILSVIYEKINKINFHLEDLYEYEDYLKSIFINNNNIRPKIRQILQQLISLGYLNRIDDLGNYKKHNQFLIEKYEYLTDDLVNETKLINQELVPFNSIFPEIKFIEYLKENSIEKFKDLNVKDIFIYYKVKNSGKLYSKIDTYINERIKYNETNVDKINTLCFEDYYVIIHYFELITNDFNPNIFEKKENMEILNKYSEKFDMKKLREILDIKFNIIKEGIVKEDVFFQRLDLYKEEYRAYGKNKVKNKKIPLFENLPKSIIDKKKSKIEHEEMIVTKAQINDEKKVSVNNNIYKEFLKGEILYGRSYGDLILNAPKMRSYLNIIINDECKYNDINKIYYKYKYFKEINYGALENFHNKKIDTNEFRKEVNSNIYDYYNKIEKRISLQDIYEVFVNTTMYLKYFKEVFDYDMLQTLLNYHNLDNALIIGSTFNKYWQTYYDTNKAVFNSYKNDINNLGKFLRINETVFIEKARFKDELLKTYYKIDVLPKVNDKRYITNIINKKDLKERLISNNINTLLDLKFLTKNEINMLIRNKEELDEFNRIINISKISIQKQLKEKLNTFLNSKIMDREEYILDKRSLGMTLEEIGNLLDVTRERIRQIENRAQTKYNRFKKANKQYYDLFKTFNISGTFVDNDDLMLTFIDKTQIFKHLNRKTFNKELNILELVNLNLVNKTIRESFENKAKKYYDQDEINNEIIQLKNKINDRFKLDINKKYLKDYIIKMFSKEGGYTFIKKPNLTDKYEIILKNHFQDFDGLNYGNMGVFKERYYEVFEDDTIYKRSDRTVLSRVTDINEIILIDRGTYSLLDEEKSRISKETLDMIYTYVISQKTVLTESLYSNFKKDVYPKIKNKYELHGLLKLHYKDLYFSKDAIGINKNPSLDVAKIINNYAKRKKGIVDMYQLQNDLPELAGIHFEFQISQMETLIGMFHSKYIHIDYIKINKEEMYKLKLEVDKMLKYNKHISSKRLFDLMVSLAPNTIRDNKINNIHYGLNVFKHIYYKEFQYVKNNITLLNSDYEAFSYNDLINTYKSKNIFKISSIRKTAEDNSLSLYSINDFLLKIYKFGFIRVEDDIVLHESYYINENSKKVIEEIEKMILYLLSTTNKVNIIDLDFDQFPQIGKPWNKHLIAHMLMSLSNKITVETIGSQYNMLDYILFKKENSNE